MNSEQLTKELAQNEQKMGTIMSQMDNLYDEIKAAMPAAATSWMATEVERKIKDNPEVVQSLGIDKLGELKTKLKTLTDKLPVIVEAEFHDCAKWPHHNQWAEIPAGFQKEQHLYNCFRNVIGNLGTLLDEFGLIKEPKGHIPSSWERSGQAFRYAMNPGPNNLPETKIQDYWKLFNEFKSLSGKVHELRKSLSEAKAKELWDKA